MKPVPWIRFLIFSASSKGMVMEVNAVALILSRPRCFFLLDLLDLLFEFLEHVGHERGRTVEPCSLDPVLDMICKCLRDRDRRELLGHAGRANASGVAARSARDTSKATDAKLLSPRALMKVSIGEAPCPKS